MTLRTLLQTLAREWTLRVPPDPAQAAVLTALATLIAQRHPVLDLDVLVEHLGRATDVPVRELALMRAPGSVAWILLS